MEDIDIPSYFLCPISLQILRDPVTLSTGITYERESIEKWLYTGNNNTCPITKQVLVDQELIPNHALRRLTQAWCTLNASYGIERLPTPKPPVDNVQIAKIISNAKIPQLLMLSLSMLKSIAAERDGNKKCIESTHGAIQFLASVVKKDSAIESMGDGAESARPSDEALGLLHSLQMSEAGFKTLIGKNGEFIDTLVRVMRNGSYKARTYAILLLKPILEVADKNHLMNLKSEIFIEVVNILCDNISHQARQAALQILIEICPSGRNKVKAVGAGAVRILIELLLEKLEKRETEMILVVLDQLCGCAEGRAELLKHAIGVAAVSEKIVGVSQLASERAVRILYSVSKFSGTSSVAQEMLQVGVVSKLCLVLQMGSTLKTKEKAKEMLRLHYRCWKSSHCIPPILLSSYLVD